MFHTVHNFIDSFIQPCDGGHRLLSLSFRKHNIITLSTGLYYSPISFLTLSRSPLSLFSLSFGSSQHSLAFLPFISLFSVSALCSLILFFFFPLKSYIMMHPRSGVYKNVARMRKEKRQRQGNQQEGIGDKSREVLGQVHCILFHTPSPTLHYLWLS